MKSAARDFKQNPGQVHRAHFTAMESESAQNCNTEFSWTTLLCLHTFSNRSGYNMCGDILVREKKVFFFFSVLSLLSVIQIDVFPHFLLDQFSAAISHQDTSWSKVSPSRLSYNSYNQGPTSTRYSDLLYYSNPTRKFLKNDRVASSMYSSLCTRYSTRYSDFLLQP